MLNKDFALIFTNESDCAVSLVSGILNLHCSASSLSRPYGYFGSNDASHFG